MKTATMRGSALLIVLWALILLTAAVFSFARWMQSDIALHAEANRHMEARAMAHSGIAMALNPLVTPKSFLLLEEELSYGQGFRVRMIPEGGKLNLRFLLEGEEPARLDLLKRWMESRGLEFKEREVLVDCLLDYIDTDDAHRLNGVEAGEGYQPANRPLRTIEEVAEVSGSEPLLRSAGWRDDLTLWSDGPIALRAAPAEILRLLPGLSEPNIQRFIQYRQGPDKLDATEDDGEFKNDAAALSLLGLNQQQVKTFGGLISAGKTSIYRILSEGRSGKARRVTEVIANKGGGEPAIRYWKE